MKPINKYIDHTLLHPSATENDIIKLCDEAIQYDFYSVCVNSSFVATANTQLKHHIVSVCSVVGFPLGAMSTAAKVYEAKKAIEDGADEIDMVINIGFLKSKNYDAVIHDILEVKNAIGNHILKVILEISELTNNEIAKACKLCVKANADFVKTSTGFGSGGATIEAIKIMKTAVKRKAQIKASGGIKDLETAKQFIDLGADRLGVSSGIAIIKGKIEYR